VAHATTKRRHISRPQRQQNIFVVDEIEVSAIPGTQQELDATSTQEHRQPQDIAISGNRALDRWRTSSRTTQRTDARASSSARLHDMSPEQIEEQPRRTSSRAAIVVTRRGDIVYELLRAVRAR
jgi:hypothetical protein